MTNPCRMCGGAAHPATGCEYAPGWIVCNRCTREAWAWLLRHVNGKGGRSRFYFYEYATRKDP